MKSFLKNIIKNIRRITTRVILGKDYCNFLDQALDYSRKNKKEIAFLSMMMSEQTKLLGSLAIVQSDLAKSIDKNESLLDDKDYITLKIPIGDDEFTN